ncbi:MAG: hypothetical protein OXU79_11835 [Gemmatimonadota bacterium]|nr:hypothetical protein [Gemmatimonadota bacterium]
MDVEQVRQLIEDAFPELIPRQLTRDNVPCGWSFYYRHISRGRCIIRVTQLGDRNVRLRRVVSDQESNGNGSTENITGRESELCGIVRQEIARWICEKG